MGEPIMPVTEQSRASDPAASAWVSANAGSGKTHVLVNRIVRLLLMGTVPARILCLTFTRAAAAEMADRLFRELSNWIALDDVEIAERIHSHTGHIIDAEADIANARRLFARALETPGGLKVQTIHAFCERLLQRFPVEAGMVPGFAVMDEQMARDVLAQASATVLAEARAGGDPSLIENLATISAHANPDQFDKLLSGLLSERHALDDVLHDDDSIATAIAQLAQTMSISPDDTMATIEAETRRRLVYTNYEILLASPNIRSTVQAQISALIAADSDREVFEALRDLFLTKGNEPRKPGGMTKGKAEENAPEIWQILLDEQRRLQGQLERWRSARVLRATHALLHFGSRIIEVYEREKRRQGLCDYDDLILRASNLLDGRHASLWVLYKLDGGLDHVLIDEAQDTSPLQWSIIARLTEEFFAGEGARGDIERTVFAVGDYKQSIFSFQGAEPKAFAEMRTYFRQRAEASAHAMNEVPLQVSFRSVPEVLQTVDRVFALPDAGIGLKGVSDSAIAHKANREGQAGRVELWPLTVPDEPAKAGAWRAPKDIEIRRHPRLKLAQKIAKVIRHWIDTGEELTPRGRPVRYSDILILVRNRTTLMDAIVRALKLANVPVAGADRLTLTRHIAVQDLMALARFVLLPEDDLTLAAVLKSPLVARDDGQPIDDDDLFSLAHGRGTKTLWQSLQAHVRNGLPLAEASQQLRRWRSSSGYLTPHQFFSRVLVADGKRKALLTRLGTEAADPIDAFMAEALNYENGRVADLHGFLGWLEGAELQIKRDMDHSANEVRVMTVHGAKGLEANIVILPDTTDVPDNKKMPGVLVCDEERLSLPVWRLTKDDTVAFTQHLQDGYLQSATEEYNRLLYVAMTRARDRLYVCGFSTKEKPRQGSWYDLVHRTMAHDNHRMFDPVTGEDVWRIDGKQTEPAVDRPEDDDIAVRPVSPPDWARSAAVPEPDAAPWLAPSRIGVEGELHATAWSEMVEPPQLAASDNRFRRGNLIHKLLQILPDLPPERRSDVAARFIGQRGHGLGDDEAESILDEVFRLIEDPTFAAIFGRGSRAEVPIAARLSHSGKTVGLTGQIDRLLVDDDRILIVDYKTNRPAPATIEGADPAYIRQLAAYRLVLKQVYPRRPVLAGLLWTNSGRLMQVPAALLDAALPDHMPV